MQDTREYIADRFRTGNFSPGDPPGYSLEGREGVGKYLSDSTAIATGGRMGNLAATYPRSYDIDYQVLNVDQASGSAQVLFMFKIPPHLLLVFVCPLQDTGIGGKQI